MWGSENGAATRPDPARMPWVGILFEGGFAIRTLQKAPVWLQKMALPVFDAAGAYLMRRFAADMLFLELKYKATAGEPDRRIPRQKLIKSVRRFDSVFKFCQAVRYLQLCHSGLHEFLGELRDEQIGIDPVHLARRRQSARFLEKAVCFFEGREPPVRDADQVGDLVDNHTASPSDTSVSLGAVGPRTNSQSHEPREDEPTPEDTQKKTELQ